MKFRQRFFAVLAVLAILWMCGGGVLMSNAVRQTVDQNPNADGTSADAAFNAGAGIGGGIGVTFFACTGIPALLLFGLLSWRNGVGIKTEKRHQEQIEALKGKPS